VSVVDSDSQVSFRRLYTMRAVHEMLPIVTDVCGLSVCTSVCLSRDSTQLRCAKAAEQIKMLFGVNTLGGPRDIVLVRGS